MKIVVSIETQDGVYFKQHTLRCFQWKSGDARGRNDSPPMNVAPKLSLSALMLSECVGEMLPMRAYWLEESVVKYFLVLTVATTIRWTLFDARHTGRACSADVLVIRRTCLQ
jgi:hypothetical protein